MIERRNAVGNKNRHCEKTRLDSLCVESIGAVYLGICNVVVVMHVDRTRCSGSSHIPIHYSYNVLLLLYDYVYERNANRALFGLVVIIVTNDSSISSCTILCMFIALRCRRWIGIF